MASHYARLHHVHMAEQTDSYGQVTDPVTLENINPVARNFISYLVLNNDVPKKLDYWDTEGAYATFITNPRATYPLNNLPLNPAFTSRIQLYKESKDRFGNYTPTPADLNACFMKYLSHTATPEEILFLRSFLFLDDTSVIRQFEASNPSMLRQMAEAALREAGNGSWLFRKSSVIDTDLCKAKVLSFLKNNEIAHFICIHISGYGYYSPGISSGHLLPALRQPIPIPSRQIKNSRDTVQVFPCLLDWLHDRIAAEGLDTRKLIGSDGKLLFPPVAAPMAIAAPMNAAAAPAAAPNYNGIAVVFDFDCTLTTSHFYHYMHSTEYFSGLYPSVPEVQTLLRAGPQIQTAIRLGVINDNERKILIDAFFGGEVRFKRLFEMIQTLRMGGAAVYISSRGIKEEIENFLSILGINPQALFNGITGGNITKPTVILPLAETMRRMYYFDDDPTEHYTVIQSATPGSQQLGKVFDKWRLQNAEYYYYKHLTKDKWGGILNEHLDFIFHAITTGVQGGKRRKRTMRKTRRCHSKKHARRNSKYLRHKSKRSRRM
uniref:Uncharacterized protein n=1 Tax=viral metagenome TaxID=1070528 RepID=A0A6C0ILM1_9ZZZZ